MKKNVNSSTINKLYLVIRNITSWPDNDIIKNNLMILSLFLTCRGYLKNKLSTMEANTGPSDPEINRGSKQHK